MADKAPDPKFQKELNAGAISLVLLSLLKRHGEPMYGYEIAGHLAGLADEGLPMNQGAIYPVLRSMHKRGLLQCETLPSESGPPRKYYQVTAAGSRALSAWTASWRQTTRFVNAILEPSDDHSTPDAGRQVPADTRNATQGKKRSRS